MNARRTIVSCILPHENIPEQDWEQILEIENYQLKIQTDAGTL